MNKIFKRLVEQRALTPDFLHPRYEDLPDPLLLPDMQAALTRLVQAAERQERVLICGDYDADGVTASTVMYDTLKLLGLKNVQIRLPHRVLDGYGMNKKIVQKCQKEQIDLVVTVDTGSRECEVIQELTGRGVDCIVTDHHECGGELPACVAVVNPKRSDVAVPAALQSLAGVGVAFMVALGLARAGKIPAGQEKWLLDLVLIGTLCDSMQMTGANRILCYYGQLVLAKTRRPGLKELMQRAGVKEINAHSVGFQLGPRLNAAGRMDSADLALRLVRATTRSQAAALAEQLEQVNNGRRQAQQAAVSEIETRLSQAPDSEPVLVVTGDWHEGVLGIIAGRLVEEYKKPAFVLAETEPGVYKGSGRSFGEFNLAQALAATSDLTLGGGGHAEACGVKVASSALTDWRRALNRYYRSLHLENQTRFLRQSADLSLRSLDGVDVELTQELQTLEPYGPGNTEPVFLLHDLFVLEVGVLGSEGQHLRFLLRDQAGQRLKIMAFYAPEAWHQISKGRAVDAWVTLALNSWQGQQSVEGRVVRIAAI